MTKKDFELIARVIESLSDPMSVGPFPTADRDSIAHVFAQALSDANPRFDALRFLEACGVES